MRSHICQIPCIPKYNHSTDSQYIKGARLFLPSNIGLVMWIRMEENQHYIHTKYSNSFPPKFTFITDSITIKGIVNENDVIISCKFKVLIFIIPLQTESPTTNIAPKTQSWLSNWVPCV